MRYRAAFARIRPGRVLYGSPAPLRVAGDSARRPYQPGASPTNCRWTAVCCPNIHLMPRPTQFGRDTGLQVRMVTTLFLLGAVYALLIGVLFAAGASGVTILVVAVALL